MVTHAAAQAVKADTAEEFIEVGATQTKPSVPANAAIGGHTHDPVFCSAGLQ